MLRIRFVDGFNTNLKGQSYIRYFCDGRIHSVVGCMIYYGTRVKMYLKEGTPEIIPDNTIYIVRQKNKRYQLLIFIHEFLHYVVSNFTDKRYLHNLIDKHL
ncbi:hypothetical protein CVT91_00030 [Candidatus Atribacteria bacterium HGW-Atribacteria-1]|nr:MAG: hypothetical protein CVT91_00030 [Candidatus Atribacteria bacterium HGW-Atribacteria-1]